LVSGTIVTRITIVRSEWRVVVNGQLLRFAAGTDITVRTGPGDDHVTVSAMVGVTVLGGTGDDEVYGGEGDDRLYGGPGDDYLDGPGHGPQYRGSCDVWPDWRPNEGLISQT
jgi:Ca2+-binding RTX toxin-like protein